MTQAIPRRNARASFARNVLWSFLGTGLPMLVALPAVPQLIRGLGTARFGVLSLAWMIVGYFSLFDLGLGRALTKVVAEKLGKGQEESIPALVWSAMVLMTALGLVGAAVTLAVSPYLVHQVLEIPADLRAESLSSFYLLALSIPVVIGSTGLRGLLEAHQLFGLANAVRVPLGVVTYLGPLGALSFSRSLTAMVAVLVVARLLSLVAYLALCLVQFPELRRPRRPEAEGMRQLLSFGGWMTVSNVVGPLLLYLGRFLIAALLSAEAVAYFSTPYEVVAGLLVIPGVLVGVLFPAFAQLIQEDPDRAARLYRRGQLLTLLAMLPPVLLVLLLARTGLAWWIDAEFAAQGHRVARWLALGVFINSFGHVAQALVQASGRPDLTAKLHVAELVAYLPYLWLLTARAGIDGAAMAWVVRVTISTSVLVWMAHACIRGSVSRAT